MFIKCRAMSVKLLLKFDLIMLHVTLNKNIEITFVLLKIIRKLCNYIILII